MTDQPRTDQNDTERNRGQLDPDATSDSDQQRAPEAERSATDTAHRQDPGASDRNDQGRRDSEDSERSSHEDPERSSHEDPGARDGAGTDRGNRQSDPQGGEGGRSNLVGTDERAELRERWDGVQTSFIDDPRAATAEADALLRDTMERVVSRWEKELSDVRHHWDSDEDRSTEELRVTMRRYRDTLERLLSA